MLVPVGYDWLLCVKHTIFLPLLFTLFSPSHSWKNNALIQSIAKGGSFQTAGSVHGVRDPLVLPDTNVSLVPKCHFQLFPHAHGCYLSSYTTVVHCPHTLSPSFFSHNCTGSVKSLHLCQLYNLHHLMVFSLSKCILSLCTQRKYKSANSSLQDF